ncbi:hypothetical protein SAMN04489761_3342 [Tenacibaculum sp. MAR_2009_124]|uniref:hypothetical protein n=1 Tax=Tenacibaculum sp. MAR_2009_124 TaxID=1250059 RepID=UPI0008964082|nr:hypothetical protein [Tenacibaculum sp. MAR_2009_124]SEC56565.1 hypothetical protein SAMN04489761_3342 [Tenacibaculum sp. MAR_2009_124]
MLLLLNLLLVFFLGLIFLEDFKFRLVNILYFGALIIISFTIFILKNGIFKNLIFSLFFLLLNLFFIKVYTIIKEGGFKGNLFKIPDLAEGDILFFLVVIPLFSFFNYVVFFITGLLISLLIHVVVKRKIDKRETIPLAGYLALYLGILVLLVQFSERNLYVNVIF